MKQHILRRFPLGYSLAVMAMLGLAFFVVPGGAQESAPLRQIQVIPLENVEGRIDHFSVDLKGQRLFMSALGNDTLEVFDLRTGRRIHTIPGLGAPQGNCFVPESHRLFVANDEGGIVEIFDGDSFQLLTSVDYSDDADNVRYDPRARRVFVGYGNGALGILDAESGKRLGDIKLDGHPESFQLEKNGPRIFVNVPDAREIEVVDRDKQVVTLRWPLNGDHANFPMALDELSHRLLVACRKPAELLVLDTESGRIVARVACAGDADDLFYDAARKRIYVSGGEGFLSVIEQRDADHYTPLAKIPTAPGARTSFFVPDLNRLLLAVPHRGAQQAEVRVYEVGP